MANWCLNPGAWNGCKIKIMPGGNGGLGGHYFTGRIAVPVGLSIEGPGVTERFGVGSLSNSNGSGFDMQGGSVSGFYLYGMYAGGAVQQPIFDFSQSGDGGVIKDMIINSHDPMDAAILINTNGDILLENLKVQVRDADVADSAAIKIQQGWRTRLKNVEIQTSSYNNPGTTAGLTLENNYGDIVIKDVTISTDGAPGIIFTDTDQANFGSVANVIIDTVINTTNPDKIVNETPLGGTTRTKCVSVYDENYDPITCN